MSGLKIIGHGNPDSNLEDIVRIRYQETTTEDIRRLYAVTVSFRVYKPVKLL
jgi:hypothetical protein